MRGVQIETPQNAFKSTAMDRFALEKLMASVVYAGLCKELGSLLDETSRDIRRKQLIREAKDTARKLCL